MSPAERSLAETMRVIAEENEALAGKQRYQILLWSLSMGLFLYVTVKTVLFLGLAGLWFAWAPYLVAMWHGPNISAVAKSYRETMDRLARARAGRP
jgi:hypothetical protein